MSLLASVLPWCLDGFALALLLNAWRLFRGPALEDRILALDTLYINTLALLVLLGISMGTHLFFDAALLISMLGFVSTLVLSKFLLRSAIVE